MSTTNTRAVYSIGELHRFPTFSTPEDYRNATGLEAPPYDPGRPPKTWFDPGALASVRPTVLYDPVLATTIDGTPLADADGKPVLDVLALSREHAATVNIWNTMSGHGVPTTPAVPIPLRPLKENEELFFSFPQVVSVRDKDLAEEIGNGQFTGADRRLLRLIAEKLGVAL